MTTKRPLADDDAQPTIHEDTYLSDAIRDRKSTFIGYYSPSKHAKALQALPELRSASCRIAAWRTPSKQTTLKSSASLSQERAYQTGHDDDGEQWAGKRLERVLEDLDVEGSLVVARWYGGVLLGPVRFTHIADAGKQAIRRWQHRDDAGAKRQRIDASITGERPLDSKTESSTMQPEDVQRKRESIISELQQRDHSITVLRDLLDQKRAKIAEYVTSPPQSSPNPQPSSPPKKPNYSSMTLIRLQALEKARDASIEFLLKQIDKAEEHEKRIAAEEEAQEGAIDEAWEQFEKETTKGSQVSQTSDSAVCREP